MASREIQERFHHLGAVIPHIYLPSAHVDFQKFSVIACDQFSSDPSYWDAVETYIGQAFSSLHMVFPEAWLGKRPNPGSEIRQKMRGYLDADVLTDVGQCLVYVKRQTSAGVRKGIVLALDLEEYDYSQNSDTLIRATEETIEERLPARIEIRRGAELEIPHILVLIDDHSDALMGALEQTTDQLEVLYDFNLMMDGGHITGYKVEDELTLSLVAGELEYRLDRSSDRLLYAMGDGNHSFAAAKACWDEIKQGIPQEQWVDCPARYCLCELINLYDPALTIEPIHRALFGVDPIQVMREVGFDSRNPPSLQILQPKLDAWLEGHPEAQLEYVHGKSECLALCNSPDRLAIIFSDFDRDSLFDVVRRDGAFVRKSFSLGQSRDKRYYLESRKIQE